MTAVIGIKKLVRKQRTRAACFCLPFLALAYRYIFEDTGCTLVTGST